MRRLFALAVVLLHVLLLAFFMSGVRVPLPELQPEFVSLWLNPVASEPIELSLPEPAAGTPRAGPVAPVEPVPVETPPTEAPAAESPAATSPDPAPTVDWAREGTLSARRAGESLATPPQTTFSPPPKSVPKPCKPRESSMQWNGGEDRAVTWAGPLPVIKVGKRCVVMLVFFACTLGELPEANSHLLDDMRRADRSPSSVPDPNICD